MDLCHIEIVTSEKDVPSSFETVVSICVCCVCCVLGKYNVSKTGQFGQERHRFLNYNYILLLNFFDF